MVPWQFERALRDLYDGMIEVRIQSAGGLAFGLPEGGQGRN